MSPGDIVFVMHHDSKISRLIAWFMGSAWSHTGLIFGDCRKWVMTTETNVFCVKHGSMRSYDEDTEADYEVWSPIAVPQDRRELVADTSMMWVDAAYGWLQLLSLGVRRLLMRVGWRIPNFIRQGLVCNHVVLYAYAGLMPEFPADPESIDTEELYQIVKRCGRFRLVREKRDGKVLDVS